MSYDSFKDFDDIVAAAFAPAGPFEQHLAEVCIEHGVSFTEPRPLMIQKILWGPDTNTDYAFPLLEAQPVESQIAHTNQSASTKINRWLLLADNNADPELLRLRIRALATACVRTFAGLHSPTGRWECSVVASSEVPPGFKDELWVRAHGVRIELAIATDL